MRTSLPCILAFAVLAGCATVAPLEDRALLAPDVTLAVSPSALLGQTVEVAQSIVAHYRGQSFAFDTQIQISPGEFDLVALDGFGRRAFTIRWSGGSIAYDAAPWLPPLVRPADVLADIAFVYSPADALQSLLENNGAVLITEGQTRKIAVHGRDLVVVEYGGGEGWNRSATLRNLALGYDIDIRSVQLLQ